jgi:hypothetical protein
MTPPPGGESLKEGILMTTAPYSGKVFGFPHHRCAFVDAVKENGTRVSPPQIIDKKGGPNDSAKYRFHPLNDSGAFILVFLLQRVDTDVIKQAYMSEYGITDETVANADIKALIDDLKGRGLIKEVARQTRQHEVPQVKTDQHFGAILPIDFGVNLNQMGGYRIKIPT